MRGGGKEEERVLVKNRMKVKIKKKAVFLGVVFGRGFVFDEEVHGEGTRVVVVCCLAEAKSFFFPGATAAMTNRQERRRKG